MLNRSFYLLLAFVILCTIATVLCTVFLPVIVPKENHCVDHDVRNEGTIQITSPRGKTLKILLNTRKTSKKYGKYYHCDKSKISENVSCTSYRWQLAQYIRSVTDCFELEDHWFGGSALWRQEWPINGVNQSEAAFVPGDIYKQQYGGVMERFWIGSGGFSIFAESNVSLLVELRSNKLCLTGSRDNEAYDMSAQNNDSPLLAYTVCNGPDMKTLYRNLRHWKLPTELPERELFTKPIWSTWAYLKQSITAKSVLDFASNISDHKLSCSQIEIDDKWSSNYGDFKFDSSRFSDSKKLVEDIHKLGYNVTLWVHPFANSDTQAYSTGLREMGNGKTYLVAIRDNSTQPGLTNWWRGNNSTLIDITDNNSTGLKDLKMRLQNLRESVSVDSFKFDGGEASWLPSNAQLAAKSVNPGVYTQAWSQLAYESDSDRRRQETRVGFRAQHLPILVRTMDKDSHWGINNGLKAVVTSALTHCLIGYNFLLPDMVGGNAYCNDTGLEGHCNPDRELFIRWLQLSVFMPSLQLSVPPWIYDSRVIELTRDLLALREDPRFVKNMDDALQDAMQGIPIVRPIWWVDDTKPDIADQYLLGSSILVAPILDEGATSREIYFPSGEWKNWFNDSVTYKGPESFRVDVPLETVAAFYAAAAARTD